MLINDHYKFVFVHIQKTAGTSISSALRGLSHTRNGYTTHSFLREFNYPPNYFKFGFVRNPWDRLVSWYNMHKNLKMITPFPEYTMRNTNSFSDFLKKTEVVIEHGIRKSIYFNQLEYLSDENGNILADFIGKFENVDEDVKTIGEKLGIEDLKIPILNKLRPDQDDYRKHYKDDEIEFVSNMYKKDIEYFNYKF